MSKKKNKKFDSPDLFVNRELSWLQFNQRVLIQGLDESLPLLERLKFLAIVSSNLDEFFMVRVAGLFQQRAAGIRKRDISGLTATQQLKLINVRVAEMIDTQSEAIRDIFGKLKAEGLSVTDKNDWTIGQREYLERYFANEISPVLTPMAMDQLQPSPLLTGRQLTLAAAISTGKKSDPEFKIVLIPVPSILDRFVRIPSEGTESYALIEDVIAENIDAVFEKEKVRATAYFRILRDADVAVQGDEADDLLGMIERAVIERQRRGAVYLGVSGNCDKFIKKWLIEWLKIEPGFVFEIDGILDRSSLMQLAGIRGFEKLKIADWPPQKPKDLLDCEDIFETLQQKDVLLFHPFESFEPVVEILQKAADDPDVLAIKQTLYRTSADSPIIRALVKAAENGKEVSVLVELKARFDEARNVNWARKLEDAGCHVIYGVAGLKTHAKAMLIVRRENGRIHRYAHLATGNYNDKTAKLYSDAGLLTADNELTADVGAFFNLLTGSSELVGWSKMAIAPTDLRNRIEDLIEREIRVSTPDKPGLIMAKINSLEDKSISQMLYRASQAGVKVKLNIRGICCLRPAVKGVSENIEVLSIVDRFLEHARIFYFANGGHTEFYLSSADWMGRNLDKRLETFFPVTSPKLTKRLKYWLDTYFQDNQKAFVMKSDGSYEKKTESKIKIRAQQQFYDDACQAVGNNRHGKMKFIPLSKPQEE